MNAIDGKVADAPSGNWVYRFLPRGLWPYAQLARWDRPIGWWLLLWPCWWSLALALTATSGFGETLSPLLVALLMALFLVGAVAMRGAGCSYNDIVDMDLDARVSRTASRPIPSGTITKGNARIFVAAQAFVGLLVLLSLCLSRPSFNTFAFGLALASLVVVIAYPFAKRVTDWPQLVLGLSFSWGALMGWAVVFGQIDAPALILYAAAICWTIGYDTIYAHQDREDDALIGVRSTARLFGARTKAALIVLYTATIMLAGLAAWLAGARDLAFVGLALAAFHMVWQIVRVDIDDPDICLAVFKSNKTFGVIVFAGLLADAL